MQMEPCVKAAAYLYGFAAVQVVNPRDETGTSGKDQALTGLGSFLWSRCILVGNEESLKRYCVKGSNVIQ